MHLSCNAYLNAGLGTIAPLSDDSTVSLPDIAALNAAQPAAVPQGACIVRYLLPFDVIKQPAELSTGKDHVTATMAYERLLELIRHLLSQVVLD